MTNEQKVVIVIAALAIACPATFVCAGMATMGAFILKPYLWLIVPLLVVLLGLSIFALVIYRRPIKPMERRHPGWDEPESGWDGRDAPPGFKYRAGPEIGAE